MQGRRILEFRSMGHQGQVYVHLGMRALQVYYGPIDTAHSIYSGLQQFAAERKQGSGEWYEQITGSGRLWMEKG